MQHSFDDIQVMGFTIGDLCNLFDITPRALRFYEGRGLVAPRRSGRTRIYSSDDVARIEKIVALKSFRFSLSEIAVILRRTAPPGAPLPLTAEQVSQQISLLQDELRSVSKAIEDLSRLKVSMLSDENDATAARVMPEDLVAR